MRICIKSCKHINRVMQFITRYPYGSFAHAAPSKNIFLQIYNDHLYNQRSVMW